MPRFDFKIDISGLVTVIIAILSAGVMYGSINVRLNVLEEKVAGFSRVMDRIISLESQLIRVETKLDERSVREERLSQKLDKLEESVK
jgi:hypothetical protein